MTLTAVARSPMARTRSKPPTYEPTPASRALKLRRTELGKSQADVAFDSELLTQTTVSELERGKYGPEDLTAARLAALAKGLDWTVLELERATGVNLGLTGVDMMIVTPERITFVEVKHAKALPHGLQEAVEMYGKRYSDLQDPTWQNYLAGFRWREGEPQEPEAWLDLYRDLVRAGVVPGSN